MRPSSSPSLSAPPAAAAAGSYDDADFAIDLHAAKIMLAEASFQDGAVRPSTLSASTFSHRPATARTTHVFTSFSTAAFRSVFDNGLLRAEAREEQRALSQRHAALAQLYLGSSLREGEEEMTADSEAARRGSGSSRPATAPPGGRRCDQSRLAAARAELQETTRQLQQSLAAAATAAGTDDESAAAEGGSPSSAWMAKRGCSPPARVSRAELVRYEAIFRTLDSDHSGSLSASELQAAFRSLQLPLSKDELRRVMEGIDANGDERIALTEFVQAMARGAARGGEGDWDCLQGIQRDRRERRLREEQRRAEAGRGGKVAAGGQRAADGQLSKQQGDVLLPFSLWVPAWSRKQRFEQLIHSEQRARQRQEARMARQQQQQQGLRSRGAAASVKARAAASRVFSDHSYVALQPVSFVPDSAASDPSARSVPSLEVEGTEEEADRASRPVPASPLLGRRLVRRGSVEVEWVRKEEEQDDAGSLVWKWKRTRQRVAAAAEQQQEQQRQQRSRAGHDRHRSGCSAEEALAADASLDDSSCLGLPVAVKLCGCTRRTDMPETPIRGGRKGRRMSGAAGRGRAEGRRSGAQELVREQREHELLRQVNDSVGLTQKPPTAERAASARTRTRRREGGEVAEAGESGAGIDPRREQRLLGEVETLLQQELLDALLLDSEAAIAHNREAVAQLALQQQQQGGTRAGPAAAPEAE